MNPAFLADLILFTHAAFVAFVVLAVPVILIGAWRKWAWVHSPGFRLTHCAAILYVLVNTWLGEMCPLTIWENNLRYQAGEPSMGDSFIAYWISELLFYDLPTWAFTIAYTLFALLIVALFWIVPIRRQRHT